ncbi:MAG: sulfite exporter TauE/SafE family protein [Chromatiales bacterium]
MNGDLSWALAFATGLFGSFHCIGMCSGINAGFTMGYGRNKPMLLVAYHTTRIFVYVLFGMAGALLGQVVVQTGIVGKTQGLLMILAGVIVVLLGLNLLGLLRIRKAAQSPSQPLVISLGATRTSPPISPIVAGLLNGLVPCGLVYSVAVKAASTADPLHAGLLMLAFGAGTLPSMVTISLLGSEIGSRLRGGLARLAGVMVVLLGLWTIYEGAAFFDIMRGLANW